MMSRARPLLGTLVAIQVVVPDAGDGRALAAIDEAFAAVEAIHHAMSAHSPGSDLAKLAHARRGCAIALSPHTCAVLRAAKHWTRLSSRAFDPVRAGARLARRGVRPGIAGGADDCGSLAGLEFAGDSTVIPDGPLPLDLGGIAKGYAVDQAVAILRAHGVQSALVNAGGDLRAFGDRTWPIDIRHPSSGPLTTRLLRLKEGAVATSVPGGEFVAKRRTRARWHCASVQARDCMTADALTKWALQAGEPALCLRRALREHGARLLRW
jgi:thiamine biosynthesis lipoprotein